jgi:O-antigen/teichoic acid export membrane protein
MKGNELNRHWVKYLPSFLRKRVWEREYLQNVMSNTGWLLADKIIRMGVGLFVGVWVARYLGPEQFGLFSFAGAFVALFSAISTLGLDGIVVRNIVRNSSTKDETLGSAFVMKLIGGAATFLFVVVGISMVRPGDSLAFSLTGIISVGMIFQAFDAIDFWFQSQIQSKYSVYAKNSAFLIISSVKIILILSSASLIAFAWAGLAEVIIGSAGLVIAYQKCGRNIMDWRIRSAQALGLLKDSWPLMMSGIAVMIYMRVDQIMLDLMVGDHEVGIYSAAVRLAEVWYFIPMIVASSVFPSIVEAKKMSEELFLDRLQKFYNGMALISYLIVLPVTILADWVINLLFGLPYSRAGLMLAILIWSLVFVSLGVARSTFLTTMNWTKVHLITVSAGCVVNVGLNFLLIPRYGGTGAAIASCIAYWLAAHGACFFYKPLWKTGYMITKAMLYPKVW